MAAIRVVGLAAGTNIGCFCFLGDDQLYEANGDDYEHRNEPRACSCLRAGGFGPSGERAICEPHCDDEWSTDQLRRRVTLVVGAPECDREPALRAAASDQPQFPPGAD